MKDVSALKAGIPALALALGLLLCGPVLARQAGAMPAPTLAGSSDAVATSVTTPGEVQKPAEPPTDPQAETGPVADPPLPPAAVEAASPASSPPSVARTGQTSLLLEVEGGRPDLPISVAIYRDAEAFEKGEGPLRTLSLNPDPTVSRAFVVGLPAGRYAAVAWQDANGDGKPTRPRFGGASEPTGFSRNPEHRSGRPRFEDVAFELGLTGVTQRIVLR